MAKMTKNAPKMAKMTKSALKSPKNDLKLKNDL
jgi:hypothetical protein